MNIFILLLDVFFNDRVCYTVVRVSIYLRGNFAAVCFILVKTSLRPLQIRRDHRSHRIWR